MIAYFYICDSSFLYNGKDTQQEVVNKLLLFKIMIEKLSLYKDENVLYLQNENFIDTPILPNNITIGSLLNTNNNVNSFSRDYSILFLSLFRTCKKYNFSKKELIKNLELENEEKCNGILILNKQDDLPECHQVISTVDGWITFRRHYLGKYPHNPEYFLSEVKKYYKNIQIHNQNKSNYLKEILSTHSKQIIKYLAALNDNLLEDYKKFEGDFIHFLPVFAGNYGIDGASFEGKKNKKFTCSFSSADKDDLIVYCEPHLKMYNDDLGNKRKNGRIYFGPPKDKKKDKCVYIGFICKHL